MQIVHVRNQGLQSGTRGWLRVQRNEAKPARAAETSRKPSPNQPGPCLHIQSLHPPPTAASPAALPILSPSCVCLQLPPGAPGGLPRVPALPAGRHA